MSIDFYFWSSSRKGDSISENDELNKEVVEETIKKFEDGSAILKEQNILVFFDWMCFSLIHSLGRLIIKDTPSYKTFIYKFAFLKFKVKNFSDYKFIIYISRKVRKEDDKVFKVLTIAHELQHIIQFINFKDIYYQNAVLMSYFWTRENLKNELNELYRKSPIHVDAFKKSKLIAIKVCGIERVDNLIEKKIDNAMSENDRNYWSNIKYLDIKKSYDLQKEAQKFWDIYEDELILKKDEIEKKKKISELEYEEETFLEACEYYSKTRRL